MTMHSQPLVPRNKDGVLQVIVIGRISTVHQREESIEASYRYVQEHLARIYQGPLNLVFLGEQASGMLADRDTIMEAERLIESGKIDLVIAEDLSRIYRNPRLQYSFVQDAVDAGTRIICIGDNLDTGDENWEVALSAAALRHGLFIPDTRRRVRRTATDSFHKGGMVLRIRFGYRKLSKEEAATGERGPVGLRVARVEACTPVIQEICRRYLRGELTVSIAEWLNERGLEAGPYVRERRWTGRVVKDLLEDPILCGTRTFRDVLYVPIFRSGKHRRDRNATPETSHHPELAHITVEEHAQILEEMERRRVSHGAPAPQENRRRGIARSRTIWPGQSIRCAVCGELFHYLGKILKCSRTLHGMHGCWNHVQVPADMLRQQVVNWLIERIESSPEIRAAWIDAAWDEVRRTRGRQLRTDEASEVEIRGLERQAANLAQAIAQGGELAALLQASTSVDTALKAARRRQAKVDAGDQAFAGAESREDVARQMHDVLHAVAASSYEFTDLMRQVFPEVLICPVQALDTPQVRPRAKLVFRPSGIFSTAERGEADRPSEPDVQLVFDLFEPPQHIKYLSAVLTAREQNPKLSLRKMAVQLGINYMTIKRTLRYARLMEEAGVTDPYRELQGKPAEASRWISRRAAS